MPDRYELRYAIAFDEDLDAMSAYDGPVIRAAIQPLRHEAEVRTKNRRPLGQRVSWCPEASWQLRVQQYRVLDDVQPGVVMLLRVTLKGRQTSEEMGR